MTQTPPPTRHGAVYWAGITLLALWNVGMLVLAIVSDVSYNNCMADHGFMCLDFTGPILFVLFAVDAIVVLISALVHWLRVRRASRRSRGNRRFLS